MHASETTTTNRNRFLQSDLLLALEIAVPVGGVNLIGRVMRPGPLLAFSVFRIPFYDWATVVCAFWVVVVMNCGPLVAPRIRRNKEVGRCR